VLQEIFRDYCKDPNEDGVKSIISADSSENSSWDDGDDDDDSGMLSSSPVFEGETTEYIQDEQVHESPKINEDMPPSIDYISNETQTLEPETLTFLHHCSKFKVEIPIYNMKNSLWYR